MSFDLADLFEVNLSPGDLLFTVYRFDGFHDGVPHFAKEAKLGMTVLGECFQELVGTEPRNERLWSDLVNLGKGILYPEGGGLDGARIAVSDTVRDVAEIDSDTIAIYPESDRLRYVLNDNSPAFTTRRVATHTGKSIHIAKSMLRNCVLGGEAIWFGRTCCNAHSYVETRMRKISLKNVTP